MHINIIHRPEPDPYRREIFTLQQDFVHGLGMRTTIMATLPSLEDEACITMMKAYHAAWGDELGLSFHSLDTPSLESLIGYKEAALWLCHNDDKRKIIRYHLDRFRDAFSTDPKSVDCYHLDASPMRILLEECPGVEAPWSRRGRPTASSGRDRSPKASSSIRISPSRSTDRSSPKPAAAYVSP